MLVGFEVHEYNYDDWEASEVVCKGILLCLSINVLVQRVGEL